ncbi:uncharacterized protein LOC124370321 [Homalodisca vitripennis]|uniref:uncharacterized protein LOC124370321 n=1 Tax=Homalodisca vitripennis TaxID=197043 RepID=UPI001EEBF36C|nr:uncharacterized protein LOC124370321 [Homalodisca vitripennis]
MKRAYGKEYFTAKGKKVAQKIFVNEPCQPSCRNKCNELVAEEERKILFQKFYDMASFQAQNAYICGLCQQSTPITHRIRDGSRGIKNRTVRYHLQLPTKNVKVCKQYFLGTFQISNGRASRALKKVTDGKEPGSDLRGKQVSVNKTDEGRLKILRDHISSFPSYESHYTRSHNPNRKYLPESLNIREMYNLYKNHCYTLNTQPLSESMYRKVFNFEFNLHFHQPHKDTCVKCDTFKMKLAIAEDEEEKRNIERMKEIHLRKADLAREKLDAAKEESKNNSNVYSFTFDLQKALAFPNLTCSIAYYKRNMYVYNLGCHQLADSSAFMYVWNEVEGSRGSQEVASCITEHLSHNVSNDVSHVIMFSDSCGGQNRNIKLALTMMQFIQQENCKIQTVDHKFMVSGHSFLPNDADFGIIEKYSKGKTMYSPRDWYDTITKSKKKKPFVVKIMNREDFNSTQALERSITRRKTNVDKHKVSWFSIQWLRYVRDQPFKIFYKETLNDDIPFDCLDITPAKKGRQMVSLASITTEALYSSPRPVTAAKKKDMMDLLAFIPPIHHSFYTDLTVGNQPEGIDDTPIIDRCSESESDDEKD